MQGLAGGQLGIQSHAQHHLDRCLDCRNCEKVCPAGVEYEALLDTTQQWLARISPPAKYKRGIRRLALGLLAHPSRLRQLNNLLHIYQRSGLRWLLRRTGVLRITGLAYVDSLLPPLRTATRLQAPPDPITPRGHVALFTGCLGSTLEQDTLDASIKLLDRLGYAIKLVPGQTCCGAMSQHSGEIGHAMELARQNLQAFESNQVDAILYTSTGCGTSLLKYPELPWSDERDKNLALEFGRKLVEITAFLANSDWPQDIHWQPCQKRVAIHEPCSQRNGLRQADFSAGLLRKIPGIEVAVLAGNDRCCGAAGSYMLTQPEFAQTLRTEKMTMITQSNTDLVATTNPGCSLFLNAGLGYDKPLKVIHPVVILAEQLQ